MVQSFAGREAHQWVLAQHTFEELAGLFADPLELSGIEVYVALAVLADHVLDLLAFEERLAEESAC